VQGKPRSAAKTTATATNYLLKQYLLDLPDALNGIGRTLPIGGKLFGRLGGGEEYMGGLGRKRELILFLKPDWGHCPVTSWPEGKQCGRKCASVLGEGGGVSY